MSFIINDEQLYRLSNENYIIKNNILYLKCKDWIHIDGKSVRSSTVIKNINNKNSSVYKYK